MTTPPEETFFSTFLLIADPPAIMPPVAIFAFLINETDVPLAISPPDAILEDTRLQVAVPPAIAPP